MRFLLRQATQADRELMWTIQRIALGPYVTETFGTDETFQRRYFDEQIDPRQHQIIEVDGSDAGFLMFESRDDHVYLGNVALLPDHQRRGIGTEVIQYVIAQADEADLPVRVQVLRSNPARALYERLGFTPRGETETHFLMGRAPSKILAWEPKRVTDPKLRDVLSELIRREPLFHRPEFGTTRHDFERMTDEDFWEVGASGRRYSRDSILSSLADRYDANPVKQFDRESLDDENLEARDFHCLEIAEDNYLVTYTLRQDDRITRRSTIWRRCGDDWKIVYHQGTIVEDG